MSIEKLWLISMILWVNQQEVLTVETQKTPLSCKIDDLAEYIVCPAKYLISSDHNNRGARRIVKDRIQLGLNDLTIRSMGSSSFRDPSDIARVCEKIFENLKYSDLDKDKEAVASAFTCLSNRLRSAKLTITGAIIPFEISYGKNIVKSSVDMTLKDETNGYIYPTIIDFSKTRYEPYYNPIVYKCHTVAKNMDIIKTNTEVMVLSAPSGKKWFYDKKRYSALLEASIRETMEMIENDYFPIRVGWWCAGCYYRGICHRLLLKGRPIK